MNPETAIITGLIAGFFGSVHCVGMCGGIAGMLHAQVPSGRGWLAFGFHGGRISSYLIIALIATLIGMLPSQWVPDQAPVVMRLFLGFLMVFMAAFIALPGRFRDRIGEALSPLTQRLMPLFKHFLPVRTLDQATGLGLLWGLLPCGLLYMIIASAVLLADPMATVFMVLAFGLGTTPALLGTGLVALRVRSMTNRRDLRWVAALVMGMAGLLVALGPILIHVIDHPFVHFLADCVAPRS